MSKARGGRTRAWREVPPASEWRRMEERVLEMWRERDIFARSATERAGGEAYVF